MPIARSKTKAQGQVSTRAKARTVVTVRRAGKYKSEDIHRAVFSKSPRHRSLRDLKEGIRRAVSRRASR